MESSVEPLHRSGARPPIRTFKPRRRRLGAAAREALAGAGELLLAPSGPVLEMRELFPRPSTVVLDIGFGGGEALLAAARDDPATAVIGVEAHRPGVARVLQGIERHGLDNVRVVEGDALEFLDRVAPGSLGGIRLFFPDPWPKARHHGRRIVRSGVAEQLVERLAPGGWIHLATDAADYAVQMERVALATGWLAGGPVAGRAGRPRTRFEERARREGRRPRDLVFVRLTRPAIARSTVGP